jgi:hypothetical protein
VIGLLSQRGSYAIDALVALGELSLGAVDLRGADLPAYSCPYGLPLVSTGDTAIVVSGWLEDLRRIDALLPARGLALVRSRFRRLVGVDQHDGFQLGFTDEEMDAFEVVLKVNGVYRDSEMYQYRLGSTTAGGRWTEKTEPLPTRYGDANLRKLRVSLPDFIANVPALRRRTRRLYGQSAARRAGRAGGDRLLGLLPTTLLYRPPAAMHFMAALTHPQRAQAARLLKGSGLRWIGGITSTEGDTSTMTTEARAILVRELRAEGLVRAPLNRVAYRASMLACKSVLSITGFGEICFRMAEAWASQRVLVAQDISHVTTMFPFQAGRNVVYCRPDLQDLVEVARDIDRRFDHYQTIAGQGARDWREWSAAYRTHVRRGFAPLFAE